MVAGAGRTFETALRASSGLRGIQAFCAACFVSYVDTEGTSSAFQMRIWGGCRSRWSQDGGWTWT
jgi:hypothetical protein